MNGDGSISLRNTQQQTVYTIPAPFMVDAAGAVSYDVTYTLTEYEGDAVLTVIADEGWMEQEDRVYPVSIDPSLKVTFGTQDDDIYTAYTMEEAPNTTTFAREELFCGTSDTGGEYRLYMHINALPELPENATMTDVSLNLFMNQYGHRNMEDLPLGLYSVSDEKPSQYATYRDWFAALCWNNQPSFDTGTLLDYCTASYSARGNHVTLELTELARAWYKEENDNTTLSHVPWYELQGDYYIPCLELPAEKEVRHIGVWGQRHLQYIRQHKKVFYTNLLTSGKLQSHLADVEEQAQELFDRLMKQRAEFEGITEKLKSNNQMEWVGRMNALRSTVTETVNTEVIFV